MDKAVNLRLGNRMSLQMDQKHNKDFGRCRFGGSGLQRRVSVPDGGGTSGGGAGGQTIAADGETADGWIGV